ncbi:IucA/IucC family protein [Halobacillus sp. Cin3]|uniref:IucA/IucC family protein n=1 Tax=Halobacillus sp. Cin3 TaxID=2928441 RepID=UPI00248E5812|nr:IucA/IucC family protein [Halobacillus sp. Cin3]
MKEISKLQHQEKASLSVLHQLLQAIIREHVFAYEWKNGDREIHLKSKRGMIHVIVEKTYMLGQIDISRVFHIDDNGAESAVTTPEQLLDFLYAPDEKESVQRFYDEMVNSASNYALALEAASIRKTTAVNEACRRGAETMLSYVEHKKRENASFSPLVYFEQWVIQGHTIHPGSRTRMGLSTEDIRTFAPEWAGNPGVILAAVHKDVLRQTTMGAETASSILFKEYKGLEHAFEAACRQKEVNREDYELLPVHPWQWEHTIKPDYKEELDSGLVFPVPAYTLPMTALISFRTLAPEGSVTRHHIKTAVNVQMTSAVRTVSAASTKNGPALSRLFETLLSQDPDLAGRLSAMKESAGLHYEPKGPLSADVRHEKQKNLAAILRENPEQDLNEDEVAVPAAALVADSPISGRLIAREMMESMEHSTAASFIKAYAEAVLPPILTLLTKYGIGMEAHLQNCVVVFSKGRPERIILRDYGGIRMMSGRLERFFDQLPIDPATNLLTEQPEDLLHVFSHALLHNHFGEIITALARSLGCGEDEMWDEVRRVIHDQYEELKKLPSIQREAEEDERALCSGPSKMKALVQMRLTDQYTDYRYVDAPNPLTKEVTKK